VIVRLAADGECLGVHRIVNDPFELSAVMAYAGESPWVVIEATYGWYWAVDLLQDLGAIVHLANPKALTRRAAHHRGHQPNGLGRATTSSDRSGGEVGGARGEPSRGGVELGTDRGLVIRVRPSLVDGRRGSHWVCV
jgi:hypothetical protein